MTRKRAYWLLSILAGALAVSTMWLFANESYQEPGEVSLDSLRSIPTAGWERLAGQRIYFGHQSVGTNILEGVNSIIENIPEAELAIRPITESTGKDGPGLLHSSIGKNTDFSSKIRSFQEVLTGWLEGDVDVAVIKLCYVDVNSKTDVDAVFDEYRCMIRDMRERHPQVTIVHCTVPLTVNPAGVKTWVKRALGRAPRTRSDNIARCRFNDLLRAEYQVKDPTYDLAGLESTYPDGRRSSFVEGDGTFYSLCPDYSTDGGHLNEVGKLIAGRELLRALVEACP